MTGYRFIRHELGVEERGRGMNGRCRFYALTDDMSVVLAGGLNVHVHRTKGELSGVLSARADWVGVLRRN